MGKEEKVSQSMQSDDCKRWKGLKQWQRQNKQQTWHQKRFGCIRRPIYMILSKNNCLLVEKDLINWCHYRSESKCHDSNCRIQDGYSGEKKPKE